MSEAKPQEASVGRPLVLIHLSDIHLRKEELASTQDVYLDIRRKVLADLQSEMLPLDNGVDAILVTGDIAYGADKSEYESARAWLRELCTSVCCPASRVFVVPGNHDVHHPTVKASVSIQDKHEVIRYKDQAERLRKQLTDDSAARTLLEPFANYNVFAKHYQGSTLSTLVAWESNELQLGDGSTLRLRGLNSALVSDDKDKETGRPCQVLGDIQLQLRNDDPGVAYLTLCHHPPPWLYDEASVHDHLNSRAFIQLYGHEHTQRAHKFDNSVIVYAGALHPDRGEVPWQPRYNVMTLTLSTRGEARELLVELFPRVWKSERMFGPDADAKGRLSQKFVLNLPPWKAPPRSSVSVSDLLTDPVKEAASPTEPPMASTPREIVYNFFELSYPLRMRVLLQFGLLEPEDAEATEPELIRRVLARASAANKLDLLDNAIRKALENND